MTIPHAVEAQAHRTAGLGMAAATSDIIIDCGPAHPSSHGAMQVRLGLREGIIETAEPTVGFMHRGAEKLFESRDYRQILMLANRHDWLAGAFAEIGVALAVEKMLGMAVPERATWIRMLLCELTRAAHHAAFAAYWNPGYAQLREELLDQLDAITGGRVHPMHTRIGGVLLDLPEGWSPDSLRRLGISAEQLAASTTSHHAHDGVAVLTRDHAVAFGTSGPVARASGLVLDLRRDDPRLAYGELDVPVHAETAGDVRARVDVLLRETTTAIGLAIEIGERLATIPGPIDTRLPKVLRAPEGATYEWLEAPSGIAGVYLVSRNEKSPHRLKIRAASFNNVQALSQALVGCREEHLAAAMASFFFITGDVDR